ncbi:MAG TPA: nitroreductase/quinone reductase family protein [Candidatus Binatia bacterium]|nr:nitroreductase/quinone reductase family protein [Candidatus Binatia bacterium]
MSLPAPRASGFWRRALKLQYASIGLLDPLIRWFWRTFGLGNVLDVEVVGRRTGRPRRVLLGLLRDGNRWFLGHPNGDVAWTRNLEAAGRARLHFRGLPPVEVTAHRLPDGDLRDRAILATSQHPFPGNLVYRLARRHIRAVGAFFVLERLDA